MSQLTPHSEPGEQRPLPYHYSQPQYPPQRSARQRSYKGLIGLVVGVVALALLVCAGVGFVVARRILNEPVGSLGQTPPPAASRAVTRTPAASRAYSEILETDAFRLKFDIEPAKTGENLVHLYAFTPTGEPLKVKEWTVTVSMPDPGVGEVAMQVVKVSENHGVGTISLPASGLWRFRFTLRTSDTQEATVTAEVHIR